MPWKSLGADTDALEQVVEFAKAYYATFCEMPNEIVRKFFIGYADTTLVYHLNGKMRGFTVYQEWPEFLNFLIICLTGTKAENYKAIREIVQYQDLPTKKSIFWFDEKMKKVRKLCRS